MMKKFKPRFIGIFSVAVFLLMSVYAFPANAAEKDFSFVQLSDTHWGFSDPKFNPDYAGTLEKAFTEINNLKKQPDFIIFTGDLTHTTDDPVERRKRLTEFKALTKKLNVTNLLFIPGEHDAALDNGKIYQEIFGKTHYAFDHNGIHFIALDNVSDPASSLGDDQIKWLGKILKKMKRNSRIVIFTHRPLFDLYSKWDWWTRDGDKALELLKPYKDVTVFYGHIHQINNTNINNIAHHAANGMMFALPAPGSQPKKAWVPWDPAAPYLNLGFRTVDVQTTGPEYIITEYPINHGMSDLSNKTGLIPEQKVLITAKKFEFIPKEIHLKKGLTTELELTSLDRLHGLRCSGLNLNAKIEPGRTNSLRFVPDKTGTFSFECDIFCGEGHEDMNGTIIVEE